MNGPLRPVHLWNIAKLLKRCCNFYCKEKEQCFGEKKESQKLHTFENTSFFIAYLKKITTTKKKLKNL